MTDKDIYDELTQASPEELLEAALWFYQDYKHGLWLLQLGFNLAIPGGWKHVAPYWLQESKEIKEKDDSETEVEK